MKERYEEAKRRIESGEPIKRNFFFIQQFLGRFSLKREDLTIDQLVYLQYGLRPDGTGSH